MKLIINSPML